MSVILLVDDEPDGSEAVAKYLERGDHTVIYCGSGREALSCLPAVAPDVVLLDLSMPQMDGLSFLREVRTHYADTALPVIVLTGTSDPGLIARTTALGVEREFLKGNYHLADLLDCVNEIACRQQTATDPPQHELPRSPA